MAKPRMVMRECGPCRACCYPLGIPELKKPCFTWCRHVGEKGSPGCSIYKTRPEPCRTYTCLWLNYPAWGEDMRPNRTGFIVDFSDQIVDGKRCMYIREVRPGSSQTLLAHRTAQDLIRAGFIVLCQTHTGHSILNKGYEDALIVDQYTLLETPRRLCCGREVIDTVHKGQPIVVEPLEGSHYRPHRRSPSCSSPPTTSPTN